MTSSELSILVVVGLPLLAALLNGLNTLSRQRLYREMVMGKLALVCSVGSFVAAVWAAVELFDGSAPLTLDLYQWIRSGSFSVEVAFAVDELVMIMVLVVTSISLLVTRFSTNYMHNEDGFGRYFTVLPLFVFAMLVLVMADNILLMFLGWEGVGLCSYLLIGFYRGRRNSAAAGTKAFVMNRVSDGSLLLAMFMIFHYTDSLKFSEIFDRLRDLSPAVRTGIAFLVLIGSMAKSSQIPLGTWLARAMEGPTPSSALIHAATMVTAGVYLVVRMSPLFNVAPNALLAVGIVGVLTTLFAQAVGYAQTDVKGMLAASTSAQLGVMFMFCGLGLYAVAIFHLAVHAVYKTYLFLTAPSILHHLHGGPNPASVRRPRDTAPMLSYLVIIGAIALAALPFVESVFDVETTSLSKNLWVLVAIGLVSIFTVLFAVKRMMDITFTEHGAEDHDDMGHGEARRGRGGGAFAPLAGPVVATAVLVGVGFLLGILPGGLRGTWFHRVIGSIAESNPGVPDGNPVLEVVFVVVIVLLLLSGVFGPRYLDRFRDEMPAGTGAGFVRRLYWLALGRGYLDEIAQRYVVGVAVASGRALDRFDRKVLAGEPGLNIPVVTSSMSDLSWEAKLLGAPEQHVAVGARSPRLTDHPLEWLAPGKSVSAGGAPPPAQPPSSNHAGADRTVAAPPAAVEAAAVWAVASVSKLADVIEHHVLQAGIEGGVNRSRRAMNRFVLGFERVLGEPRVAGMVLGFALIAVIVGTQ